MTATGNHLSKADLEYRYNLSLEEKVLMTKERISDFIYWSDDNLFIPTVSVSGGIDSLVLWTLAREVDPEIPGVFSNTGLEFPEIVKFVRHMDGAEDINIVRPAKPFKKVVSEYGYPIVSKKVARMIRMLQNPTPYNAATRNLYLTGYNRAGQYCANWKIPNKWRKLIDAPFKVSDICCDCLKKSPIGIYSRRTNASHITGTMFEDSQLRRQSYLKHGCNILGNKPKSRPLSFWSKQDIWDFVHAHGLKYCEIYDMGYDKTGCTFCGFGAHLEKTPNRFQMLKRTHPKLHNAVINGLGFGEVLDYINVPYI